MVGSRPAGEFDREVLLAYRLGWSWRDIMDAPPDFVDEVVALLNAAGRKPPKWSDGR